MDDTIRRVNMDAVRDGVDPVLPAVDYVKVDLDKVNAAAEILMNGWVGRSMIQFEMLQEYIDHIITREKDRLYASVIVLDQICTDVNVIDELAEAAALSQASQNASNSEG